MLEEKFDPCVWGFITTDYGYRIRLHPSFYELQLEDDDMWILHYSSYHEKYEVYLGQETTCLEEVFTNQDFYDNVHSLFSISYEPIRTHLNSVIRLNTIDSIINDLENEAGLAI